MTNFLRKLVILTLTHSNFLRKLVIWTLTPLFSSQISNFLRKIVLAKQSGFMLQIFPSVYKSYHHEDNNVILKKLLKQSYF